MHQTMQPTLPAVVGREGHHRRSPGAVQSSLPRLQPGERGAPRPSATPCSTATRPQHCPTPTRTTPTSPPARLLVCCSSIVTALGFSTLQERVFMIPDFTYGGWMTFITYVTFFLCAYVDGTVTQSLQRKGQLRVGQVIIPFLIHKKHV